MVKVFFLKRHFITGATIDWAKVTNPVGVKGEKAAINCFLLPTNRRGNGDVINL